MTAKLNRVISFINRNKPEVKVAYYQVTKAFDTGSNAWTTYNLMYHMMAQNNSETGFIGKKIHVKGIAVKYSVQNAAVITSTTGPYYGVTGTRVLIFGHKDYQTTSSVARTQVTDNQFTVDPWKFSIDSDKAKLYKTKMITTPSCTFNAANSASGKEEWKHGSFYVPIKKDITFERWSEDYKIKGQNLYLALYAGVVGSTSGLVQSHTCTVQLKLYFTDN